MAQLTDPIRIGSLALRNRLVMPPMVTFGLGDADGCPNDRVVAHYRRRAQGGPGLIIVESTCVLPAGRLCVGQLGLWEDRQIAGHRRVVEAIHAEGVPALVQLHHGGIMAGDGLGERVSASDAAYQGRTARAMTLEEIAGVRDAYVDAARRAAQAGYDGVELHGCHAYLLNQFASPRINRRDDAYGGSRDNRLRLMREIFERIRAEQPALTVTVRMGGAELDLDEGVAIAKFYERMGAMALSVSSGMDPVPEPPAGYPLGDLVYLASQIRRHVSAPVVAVGGLDTPEKARRVVAEGHGDLAAAGRALLADPDFARAALTGAPYTPCRRCASCLFLTDGRRCPAAQSRKESTHANCT